ncbi:MAG: cupin domain-containing protein [Acidobacteria bacterium]|nr:MAG: cupin domain-containing protein [Acidobacteriota bacterium]
MNIKDWEKKLNAEGFGRTYVWQDGSGAHYPDHTHAMTTAHVILEGEMTLTSEGETRTYRAGDRCDVPANTVHSARMGPQGCRYLIGEQ